MDATHFNPANYSTGNHWVTYRSAGCVSISAPQAITVRTIPSISFNPLPDICVDAAPLILDHAIPSGGVYSGPGVSSGTFDPAAAGVGTHTIMYSYSDGYCTNEAYQTITVADLPMVSFSGIDTLYCDTDPPVLITGSPDSPPGTFSGNGITNNGDGTAYFDPSTSGLGYHQISYTFTNSTGCSSSYTRQVRVGTLLTFSGLNSRYCADNPDINFTYNPDGGTFNPATELTDNLDGTATFSPSSGSPGTRIIHYTYTDIYGCINHLEKSVEIAPVPDVNFVDLDPAGYCSNGNPVDLIGNHSPKGTFSGPGIIDNGNGTASFNPQSMPVGGPYDITYSYTDSVTGCDNTISKSTSVLSIPQAQISANQVICDGDAANLTINFTGTGPYEFTWTDSLTSTTETSPDDVYNLTIYPLQTSVYSIESLTQANGCGNTGKGGAIVKVNPLTNILKDPINKTVCPGDNASFSVRAEGEGLSYQWEKNGTSLTGENSSVLIINNVEAGDQGSYRCVVNSKCGPEFISNPADLTILPKTQITDQPADIEECMGKDLVLDLLAKGTGIGYQWKRNGMDLSDTGRISGSNSKNLNISGLHPGDAGVYTCEVTGTCGVDISDPVNLSVMDEVNITIHPEDKSVCPGDNTSFSVNATGTGLSYQWQHNNMDIAGANDPVLNLSGIDNTQTGNYRCVVTGNCDTISSKAAYLEIYQDVFINHQPGNENACAGNSAHFSISATGSNINYQWKHNGTNLMDGGDINGANTSVLTISNLSSSDAGGYTCTVSGSCGSINSSTAILVVDEMIDIIQQPLDKQACPGENVILNTEASGTNLVYQWFQNGSAISGEDTEDIIINSVSSANEGDYYNIITNSCGSIGTDIAHLTLNAPIGMNTHPSDITICEGENTSFNVAVDGSGLSYQWLLNGNPISPGGNFTGIQSSTLILENATVAESGVISCEISGSCGILTSNPATLKVHENLQIEVNPQNVNACKGSNAFFEVVTTGSNLHYQWQLDGVDLTGENAEKLLLTNVDELDEGLYGCIITGDCGSITSNSAFLDVNDELSLLSDPANLQLCEGNNANFSVSATGENISYQWKKDGMDINDGGRISGSKTNTLLISSIETSDDATYSCSVSSVCGNLSSKPADLEVYPLSYISIQPDHFEAVEGGNASFSVITEGHNRSYQWYKDGTALSNIPPYSGVQSSILTITGVKETEEGHYYCIVTGTCGTATSDPGILQVHPLSIISVHPPASIEKCEDESLSIDIVATGTNLHYQWKKNGIDLADDGKITGSNSPALHVTGVSPSDAGSYSCLVTADEGIENSFPAVVTVHEMSDIVSQTSGNIICEGETGVFSIETSGTINSYWWKKDGINLTDDSRITGSTSPTLTISDITISDNGSYTCEITGVCADDISDPIILEVSTNTTIQTQPQSKSKCAGTSANFNIVAEGGDLDYQWKKNGINLNNGGNISGANSPDLIIDNIGTSDEGAYSCIVTGNCGSKNSYAANLSVVPETIIKTQPSTIIRCEDDAASFTVDAEGSGLSFVWEKDGIVLTDDSRITGSKTSDLYLNDLKPADEGTYELTVKGSCGNSVSDPALLTVEEKVRIITQPFGDTACTGENISLSIVSDNPNDTYHWKKDGITITDDSHYSGSAASILNISNLDYNHSGIYTCEVSGVCNSRNSDLARIEVNSVTMIDIHPISREIAEGDAVSFTVNAHGENLNYRWEKDGNPLSDNDSISGSTTSVLNISPSSLADEGSYRVKVSGACDEKVSDPAILTVNKATHILNHPVSLDICEGQTALFSIEAEGENLAYKWKKNGIILSDIDGKISGSQTDNLMISNVASQDGGTYTCTVSGDGEAYNSGTATLTIYEPPVVLTQPLTSQTKCERENVYFSVKAEGDNINYEWEKDGVKLSNGGMISGVDGDILTLKEVSLSDAGVYRCIITGNCGMISSESSTLKINELPETPLEISGDTVICQGEASMVYEIPAISNASSYEWILPYGANITDGLGTRQITVNYSEDALSGEIKVYGRNTCGIGPDSNPLQVTINKTPYANAGFNQSICNNSTSLNANSTPYGEWSWVKGYATFADPQQNNTGVSNLKQGENILIWTVTENSCIAKDTVVIHNNIIEVEAGTDQVFCDMTTTLNAKKSDYGPGQWSIQSGGANFNNLSDPQTGIFNIKRGVNILTWSVNNNGCISSDTVRITNDLPDNAFAGNDTIILSDTYTLEAATTQIGRGEWSLINGSGVIQDPENPNSVITDLGTGENVFKWTVYHNSCYSEDLVKIINFTPTTNDAGPDQTLCKNNTVLEGTPPLYGTGQWTIVQGAGSFANASRYDTEVYNLGKGENIFRWTIYEYEITHDDVMIINNSPSKAIAGIDQNLCADSTIISANEPVVGTGKWSIAGGYGIIKDINAAHTTIMDLSPGSNTLNWTVSNGSCTSSDEIIIINNLPTPASAGANQTTCEDSINLYPNTPTIGKGEWSVISGAGNFSGNKAYNLGINDNLFKWTISNKGCTSSDTVIITSHKPTTSITIPSMSTCYDSVLLSGNVPVHGTGTWTILSGSADIVDPHNANTPVKKLGIGPNKFRWTINYEGCTSFSDITVNFDMIEAEAGSDQVLCDNTASISANTPSPGSGLWTIVGGSGSAEFENPDQPNTTVTNLGRGDNVLRWTISNNGCTSFDEITVTNNSPGEAYAGADRSVCGEKFSLNANIPQRGTGEWSVLSGSADIVDPHSHNSEVTNLSLGNNTLRWTVSHEGCSSSDEVVILNDQPASVSAGADQYLCADSTRLYASDTSGGSGRWSIAKGSASFSDNTVYNTNVYNLEKGENRLVWTITINGCSTSDTVMIMNNLPSLPSAGPDQDNCSSEAFMAANSPLIGTGKWSVVSGSAVFEDPSNPLTKITSAGNGTNILRWTTTNGNCKLSDDVKILNSLPTLAYAGKDRIVCNSTANLLANPPTTGTGTWKVVSGFGVIEEPGNYNTQINNLGFGANTIRWTTENGRCRTSDDIIITNNLAEVNAGEDKIVYSPEANLVGNKPASGSGAWELAAGSGMIHSPSSFESHVTDLGEGANTFLWTIDNNGCIASDDIIVSYYELPEINFSMSTAKGCPPLTVDFINSSIGGKPYNWNFGDGTGSTETNPAHTFTLPGKYTVKLTGTGPDGIMITKDTTVVVSEQPVAEMDITPATVYISENNEENQPVHFFTLTYNADSVLWDFGDGNFSNEKDPQHYYRDTGVYDVKLQVITENHCSNSKIEYDAVKVEKKGIFECPNAFTPNMEGPVGQIVTDNDYSNDIFHCYADGLLEYHLEIYNRLGILLFESDDINIGWDGYFRGELVEEGVYVYKVSGRFNNGETFNETGTLVLIHQE